MAITAERINEVIAFYRTYYKIELTRDEAHDICERTAELFEQLKRSKSRSRKRPRYEAETSG